MVHRLRFESYPGLNFDSGYAGRLVLQTDHWVSKTVMDLDFGMDAVDKADRPA